MFDMKVHPLCALIENLMNADDVRKGRPATVNLHKNRFNRIQWRRVLCKQRKIVKTVLKVDVER